MLHSVVRAGSQHPDRGSPIPVLPARASYLRPFGRLRPPPARSSSRGRSETVRLANAASGRVGRDVVDTRPHGARRRSPLSPAVAFAGVNMLADAGSKRDFGNSKQMQCPLCQAAALRGGRLRRDPGACGIGPLLPAPRNRVLRRVGHTRLPGTAGGVQRAIMHGHDRWVPRAVTCCPPKGHVGPRPAWSRPARARAQADTDTRSANRRCSSSRCIIPRWKRSPTQRRSRTGDVCLAAENRRE